MKKIGKLLLITAFVISLSSCGNGDKIDKSELIKDLQAQVDEVIKQGYQISDISISTMTFAEHGQDEVGNFRFMFISGVSPDTTIEYLASFNYTKDSKELKFLGYPVNSYNKSKGKANNFTPDLPDAISKFDEIKKHIPDGYKYENLLQIRYEVKDNQPVYKFEVELKADAKDASHPKVRKEEKKNVTVTRSTNRKKFGTTKTTSKTHVDKKTEYTITFKLIGDQIEIQ